MPKVGDTCEAGEAGDVGSRMRGGRREPPCDLVRVEEGEGGRLSDPDKDSERRRREPCDVELRTMELVPDDVPRGLGTLEGVDPREGDTPLDPRVLLFEGLVE